MNEQEQLTRKKGKSSRSSGNKAPRKLRFWLVPVLCLIALIIGLHIGYGQLGGKNMADVWDFSTWKHLYDLVFAE
jgi:hypothetical protein